MLVVRSFSICLFKSYLYVMEDIKPAIDNKKEIIKFNNAILDLVLL